MPLKHSRLGSARSHHRLRAVIVLLTGGSQGKFFSRKISYRIEASSSRSKGHPRQNFNALVMLLKQRIGNRSRVASYLMHTCPRCKYFFGVVVRSSVGKPARAVRGVCVRCRYQLSWKLICGRRSTYPDASNRPQTRVLTLIKSAVSGSPQDRKSV